MFCDILKVQKIQKPEKWAKPFNAAIAVGQNILWPDTISTLTAFDYASMNATKSLYAHTWILVTI